MSTPDDAVLVTEMLDSRVETTITNPGTSKVLLRVIQVEVPAAAHEQERGMIPRDVYHEFTQLYKYSKSSAYPSRMGKIIELPGMDLMPVKQSIRLWQRLASHTAQAFLLADCASCAISENKMRVTLHYALNNAQFQVMQTIFSTWRYESIRGRASWCTPASNLQYAKWNALIGLQCPYSQKRKRLERDRAAITPHYKAIGVDLYSKKCRCAWITEIDIYMRSSQKGTHICSRLRECAGRKSRTVVAANQVPPCTQTHTFESWIDTLVRHVLESEKALAAAEKQMKTARTVTQIHEANLAITESSSLRLVPGTTVTTVNILDEAFSALVPGAQWSPGVHSLLDMTLEKNSAFKEICVIPRVCPSNLRVFIMQNMIHIYEELT